MNTKHLIVASLLSPLAIGTAFANIASDGAAYTTGSSSEAIYSLRLPSGILSSIVAMPEDSGVVFISVLNKDKAYALGVTDSNIYEIDLQTNIVSRITATPLPDAGNLYAFTVANNTTAYVVSYSTNNIYAVNLQTGTYSTVATLNENPGLLDIAMLNDTMAYTVGYDDSKVYLVNLETGESSLVSTLPGSPAPGGIVLANSDTAYVAGNRDGTIHRVDLKTGESSILTTIAGSPALEGISINGNIAYTVGNVSNEIYAIDLLSGEYQVLLTIPDATLSGISMPLQMSTDAVSGNNLNLANYLNENTPINIIREFALLPDGLAQALESVAPTRNTIGTYAAQNTYLAASKVFSERKRQSRFQRDLPSNNFMRHLSDARTPAILAARDTTVWITPFGEYARERAQQYLPAFRMRVGGIAVGAEYAGRADQTVGIGAGYADTHVHQDNGAGHTRLNQTLVTGYSTWNTENYYLDLGLGAGYYHSNNTRNIAFPGVSSSATSHTHGWQAAPHLEVGYHGFLRNHAAMQTLRIEPFLMTDWVANWEHGFEEQGTGNFNMGQKKRFSSLFRGEGGLRFQESVQLKGAQVVFQEKASYAYQKALHTDKLSAYLVGLPQTFTVDTLTAAKNLWIGELSMRFIPTNTTIPSINLRYQGEFSSAYQSHQGMIEIRKAF